jgi:iron complex transport system substrate-binding protein
MLAIGGHAQLAAIDEYSRVVPGAADIPVIAKGSAFSREEVLAQHIDLAFIWWYQDDAAKLLGELSVPTVRVHAVHAEDLPATVRLIGRSVAREPAANRLAEDLAKFLQQQTNSAASRPRVYLELYSPYRTIGGDSFVNDLIWLAGGTNIAAGVTRSSVVLSPEQLIAANPDVILFVNGFASPEAIAQRPGFAKLRAVKQGAVCGIERDCLVAGSRLPVSVEKLRAVIHRADVKEN